MQKNWFTTGKFGLFIHFGLYSLLGGEYKGQKIRGLAEWILNNADIPLEEYRSLAGEFNPQEFQAENICRLAKSWGMRYICLTAKHHEGFALFDSKVSSYNSVQASPCKRDFVREMQAACEKYGLTFCVYYSQAQDWDDPDAYRAYHDNSHKNFERYFYGKCLPQVEELLTNYGKIGMIWFDTPIDMSQQHCRELSELVHKLQPECLISGRIGHGLGDYISTQDNRIPAAPIEKMWEVAGTMNDSWGFRKGDENWQTAATTIHKLLKIAARGGNYLLNIGPDGQGRIPSACLTELNKVGEYLEKAGESVYSAYTLPLYVYEINEYCFTARDHQLYITFFNPEKLQGRTFDIPNICNHVVQAKWLNLPESYNEKQMFRETSTLEGDPCYIVTLPKNLPNIPALTLKLTLAEADYRQNPL